MAKDENSYSRILKGTSLLGGVEIFKILLTLVRGKFVALFLGPEGMGIASLFTSAQQSISRFASLGTGYALIQESASARRDPSAMGSVLDAARILIRLTALLGAAASAILAPWLSEISFGSTDMAWQFVLLAVSIFFMVAGEGKLAIIQGLHKVRLLSLTSLVGGAAGLIGGVPLYYFFGTRGIVPAFIIISFSTWAFYSWGLRKSLREEGAARSRSHWRTLTHIFKRILSLGVALLAAQLINTLCIYGVNIFIRIFGDLADVGLFNAANSITLQYTGMLFTAISMDYFPRLSAKASDPQAMRPIIDRQMEIVSLIAAPMCILMILTAPVFIRILLTDEFLSTVPLMRWMGMSVMLKALQQPLGYIPLAKGDKRVFFVMMGLCDNILYLLCSLLFYYYFGLTGLGFGALAEQTLCLAIYFIIMRRAYGYRPVRRAVAETATGIALCGAAFLLSIMCEGTWMWVSVGTLLAISIFRSWGTLRARIRREHP